MVLFQRSRYRLSCLPGHTVDFALKQAVALNEEMAVKKLSQSEKCINSAPQHVLFLHTVSLCIILIDQTKT